MRRLVPTDVCCETIGQEQPFLCLQFLLFGAQEKHDRLIMMEIKVFYFLMNLVHFGLLPWPALLIHIKTGFGFFQHKAFRCSIFRIFLLKIEVVGIFAWPLVRNLMKEKKQMHRFHFLLPSTESFCTME